MRCKNASKRGEENPNEDSGMRVEEDFKEQVASFSWVVSDNKIILDTYQMFLDRIREYVILGDTLHANMFLKELEQFLAKKMSDLAEEEEPCDDKEAEKNVYKQYFELHSTGMTLLGNLPRSPFASIEATAFDKRFPVPQKGSLFSGDLKSHLLRENVKVP
jgi:hypothetical protein